MAVLDLCISTCLRIPVYLYLQAIELDPENESYRANLKTVEDQLRGGVGEGSDVGGATNAATGEGGGASFRGGGASQQQQSGGGGNPLGGKG